MSTLELKQKLIDKIKNTMNEGLLEEAYRLLENELVDMDVYKLSPEQNHAIREGRDQIKNRKFLTEAQADTEIDEWLSK
jgi:hypothetical protein